jgi:hypothetical protein
MSASMHTSFGIHALEGLVALDADGTGKNPNPSRRSIMARIGGQ